MDGDQQIRDRIMGRELADTCADLGREQYPGWSYETQLAYWEQLYLRAYAALDVVGKAPKPERAKVVPMTDAEARKFEITPMPFGKHVGRQVWHVLDQEPGYLDWLVRSNEEDKFKADLRRYLARADIQVALPGEEGKERT